VTATTPRHPLSDMSNVVRRVPVALRLGPNALARIDAIAAEREWTRTQAMRELLRLGLAAWDRGQR
jgi:hypothetical protein